MKLKPIPVGIEDFKDIIEKGYYYADKTMLIKELLDYKGFVNLFTRPRRFGKTLNISMLKYFFEKTEEEGKYAYLFQGLNIMEDPDCLKLMGKYPVITISLKSGKQDSWDLVISGIKKAIAEEFRRHENALMQINIEQKRMNRILNAEGDISDYMDALRFLSECLYRHYREKVIILVDEYDVPLENAYFKGFYEKLIGFIRSIFESAFKTNPYLEFAVITGCLRISKESIFTGLNNLEIVSVTSNLYAEHFGFTYREVLDLLKYYRVEERLEEIKNWYDGYVFGNTKVYNPWSVVNYVKATQIECDAFPKPYWSNTSSNDIVKRLIEKADAMAKQEIEKLISGEVIEKTIHEDITYEDIENSRDNLWNFLFFTGYLTKSKELKNDMYDGVQRLSLMIPNLEVKYIFETKIKEWFKEIIRKRDLSILYQCLLNKKDEQLENIISGILRESISFYDNKESFYHGFMIGILQGMEQFIVESNKESGDGRFDICIRSLDTEIPAVILELKIADSFSDMKNKAELALEQIEEKNYDQVLLHEGYKEIRHYGMAFYKKNCVVLTK